MVSVAPESVAEAAAAVFPWALQQHGGLSNGHCGCRSDLRCGGDGVCERGEERGGSVSTMITSTSRFWVRSATDRGEPPVMLYLATVVG